MMILLETSFVVFFFGSCLRPTYPLPQTEQGEHQGCSKMFIYYYIIFIMVHKDKGPGD